MLESTNLCCETGKANWLTQDWTLDLGHLIIWKYFTSYLGQLFAHAVPGGPGFEIISTDCVDGLLVGKWLLVSPSPWEPSEGTKYNSKGAAFHSVLRDSSEHQHWVSSGPYYSWAHFPYTEWLAPSACQLLTHSPSRIAIHIDWSCFELV